MSANLISHEGFIDQQRFLDTAAEQLLRRSRRWALSCWTKSLRWFEWLGPRVLDCLVAGPLMLLTSPLWLWAFASALTGRRPLRQVSCVGLDGSSFGKYTFDVDQLLGPAWIRRCTNGELAQLWNVLRGDMGLVGPRAKTRHECDMGVAHERHRTIVRPGIFCLWWLRRHANMAYDGEWQSDLEYVQRRSLLSDLGILARCIPAGLLGGKTSVEAAERGDLFGLPFDNVTMERALEQLDEACQTPGCTQVAFINADCVNLAVKRPEYRTALQESQLVYADGIGVKIAGALLGHPVRENVNGTDLFPRLCQQLENTNRRVYLLGGKPGVAEDVQRWIHRHHQQVNVCGMRHGYFSSDAEVAEAVADIVAAEADMVLVAMGAPHQDLWIRKHLKNTSVKVAIGVGGLFDFYSGRIPRAPMWMRELSLEWVFRLYQEPRRLARRYIIGNAQFLFRIGLQKLIGHDARSHQPLGDLS